METVLITGANRGIGLAMTREFLLQGYRVLAGCRRPEAAGELAELSRKERRLELLALDVNDEESVGAAAVAVQTRYGAVDMLVNNAGVFPENGYEAFESVNPEWFADAFQTNVVGVVRMCRRFLPLLRGSGDPRIVNITSGAGSISTKTDSHYYCYSVSKAALNMLTRAMANELREEGIIVVAVSPGWVRTEMGGPKAPLAPEAAARSLVAAMGRLSMESAGRFLNRDGQEGEYRW